MIKKISLTLLAGIILSFITLQKANTYTLTEEQMMMLYNTNNQVKQILPTSQAPAITVTQINYNIDSIQNVLVTQWKAFHPDSTTKKK